MDYTFGFRRSHKYPILTIRRAIIVLFLFLMIGGLVRLLPLLQFVIQASDDPIQLISTDLQDIKSYTNVVDTRIGQVIDRLGKMYQSYRAGINMFTHHEDDIMFVITMLQTHYHQLIKYIPQTYQYLVERLYQLSFSYDEIRRYLGAEQPQHYLVILQNTAEKRPNGGFFGSFAVITLDGGHITDFKVMDSYYPNSIEPQATVKAPDRAKSFLPTLDMGFVSINKFGFTDLDGRHIADLYSKIFHKPIAGVIFVRTDIFEYIIPGFEEQAWKLQFMNATVDLRRKQNLPNKKEYYLKYITDYFQTNKQDIIVKIIKNIDYMIQQHRIQIYLTDRPIHIESWLRKNHLTTIYNPELIYLRDSNIAYNKLDSFIRKYAELKDNNGKIVSQTSNDYLSVGILKPGIYTLDLYYHYNIPVSYKQYIRKLAQEYDIQLTDRENHILGLDNVRDTRGMIYIPTSYSVVQHEGDQYYYKYLDTDLGHTIMYKVTNNRNHHTKKVSFILQVK